ncbi:MAG TPA: hypothetical protein VLM38_20415 [Blastocatellia bacterium]|nr:hypothetical protein [Blastocatellia bacterium]
MLKRTGAIVLAVAFLSLAMAPETLACHRNRRAGYYRPAATYYRSYSYRPYTRVAGARYSRPYYSNYYGQRYRGHSTRNLVLTIAGPAAVGAGVGAIAGGGKGAGIGALVGGGGGALFYLLKHRGRR